MLSVVGNLNYYYLYCKKLLKLGLVNKSGRNNKGRICVLHRKGRNRNFYYIDFIRRINSFGCVFKVVKDSYRTANVGAVFYDNGLFSFIILSTGVYVGSRIYSGTEELKARKFWANSQKLMLGFSQPIMFINLFSLINNIELRPYGGAKLARSAGVSAVLLNYEFSLMDVKLRSGKILPLKDKNMGVLGTVSNMSHRFVVKRKAGTNFSLGRRPRVRGVAMNPCDHPHGGGEGKKSPPVAAKSPWGWLTKGTSSRTLYKKQLRGYKILRN